MLPDSGSQAPIHTRTNRATHQASTIQCGPTLSTPSVLPTCYQIGLYNCGGVGSFGFYLKEILDTC
eukprot:5972081-Amphidinium_carterae.1